MLLQSGAEKFLADVAKESVALNLEGARAQWIYANFITEDTAAFLSLPAVYRNASRSKSQQEPGIFRF